MVFEIEYCHEKICPKWDAFLYDNGGDVLQTSAWANKELKYHKRNSIRFFVKTGNILIAGCQILIINDFLLGNIGVVVTGPCFKIKTPEVMNLVVKEIKKNVQMLNLSFLIIQPHYKEHDLIPFLENEKFELTIYQLPPFKFCLTDEHTLLLDLSLSSDDLLKQMNENRRRGIKKGMKTPLQVKLGDRNDLKSFYDLYHYTVTRRKYTNPVTQKTVVLTPIIAYDELCHLWDEFDARAWVKLFLGTVDNEIICGSLSYLFGRTFQYQLWGWNGKYSEYHISDAMQWKMIQWAKTNGFQYYDFCEIDKDVAEAFRSGEPIPEDLQERIFFGPTIFKIQFGGNIISYPDVYVYYSDKMKHMIETETDEFLHLMMLYKDFYWSVKNFSRNHKVIFPCCETFFL